MNFHDAYQDDLKTAFFDPDDFASEHVIDGKKVCVVLKKTTLKNARKTRDGTRANLNPKENDINKSTTVIYIKECDVDRKLTANAVINLDGENMWINDVECMEGMYRLLIGKNRV